MNRRCKKGDIQKWLELDNMNNGFHLVHLNNLGQCHTGWFIGWFNASFFTSDLESLLLFRPVWLTWLDKLLPGLIFKGTTEYQVPRRLSL